MCKSILKFFILVFALVAANSLSAQRIPKNYQNKYTLNSMTKIAPNVFVDDKEISNLDWMEYVFWLGLVYGKESSEYKSSLPDQSIIAQQLPDSMANNYYGHPANRNFPVLGISYEQAKAYCAWRTDRVAEYMLVRMKFIKWNSNQTPDNYFSLSTYQAPKGLQFLIFSLSSETVETRYGFRCFAQWK